MYRVILIDDERFILSSLEARVPWHELGFDIVARETSASDGYEAICRLQPHLVFTDVKMPGMTGIDLMKKVAAVYPKIRFVVLSGYAQFEYVKAAMECGAEGYCVKPFDEEEIITLLKKIKASLDQTNTQSPVGIHDFYDQLLQNTVESQAICQELLQEYHIAADHSKVCCLLEPGKQFEFSRLYSHMRFGADNMEGYIIETSSPANIFSSYEEGFHVGVSATFSDISQLHSAFLQAKSAYYETFVSGKGVNFYQAPLHPDEMTAWKDSFETAVVSADFLGVQEAFQTALTFLREEHSGMEFCVYIYRQVQKICGQTVKETETSAFLAEKFQTVENFLNAMHTQVEDMLVEGHISPDEDSVLTRMERYILTKYYVNDLTLQTLAQEFQFNANYLSQLFSKSKHEKFTAYLTKVRMEHAKMLLKRSDATIGAIAEKVGYMEYFYFAKVFKKYFGMTPSDYRLSLSASE